jgi:ribonuclease HI
MMKINVDAATSKNSPRGVVAAVVCDVHGAFLGASSVVTEGMTDPESLEVLACREGLALAKDLLLQKIKLSTDCLNVVRSIAEGNKGAYGHIIQEISARRRLFQAVDIVHEGRSVNVDAHTLTRSSIYLPIGRHVWFQAPPAGVSVNILNSD